MIKKHISLLIILVFIIVSHTTEAHRYVTKSGILKVNYKAPHGKMQAENKMVSMAINTKTGEVQFNIVMLSFHFSGPFAQQQFDDYFKKNIHFSNSTFKGKIVNIASIDFNKKGKQNVEVVGEFTFRRISNQIKANVEMLVDNETISGKSNFLVNLLDYNFKLPPSMEKNVEISIEGNLRKLE